MKNLEMINRFDVCFNEFTLFIKMLNETGTPFVLVRTRNGTILEVMYQEKNDGLDENLFRTKDWKFLWKINGESINSSDLDMIETVL